MKWLFLIGMLLIPIIGLHFVYRAYRIHFKKDYSSLKNQDGLSPENPETYAESIAKAHCIGGAIIFASSFLLLKMPFVDVSKIVVVVGLFIRAHSYAMLKDA